VTLFSISAFGWLRTVSGYAMFATMIVKADKTFNRPDGAAVGVDFAAQAVHLFDKASGDRIE
jgi:hypothetical protein